MDLTLNDGLQRSAPSAITSHIKKLAKLFHRLHSTVKVRGTVVAILGEIRRLEGTALYLQCARFTYVCRKQCMVWYLLGLKQAGIVV